MNIYLIRHGSTVYTEKNRLQGCLDIPLSNEGEEEASFLSNRLAKDDFNKIYCSNLQRAKKTAMIIASPHKKAPVVLSYLREYSWGPLEGLTIDELKYKYPALMKDAKGLPLSVPGGETIRQLKGRMRQLSLFLQKEYEENSEKNIAIITHGRFLQMFLLHALRLPFLKTRPFALSPASLTILEAAAGNSYRLKLLNDTCHIKQI